MPQRSPAPIPLAAAILSAVNALGYLLNLCMYLAYFSAAQIFTLLLGFGVYGFLAAVLFFHRRDIMLPMATGALCLLNLVVLLGSFATPWSFLGALLFLVAALGLLAWSGCATLPALFEYRPLTEKFWFLPGLAAALGAFLSIAASPTLRSLLGCLFSIAVYVLLSLVLVYPDGVPGAFSPVADQEEPYEGPEDFGPPEQAGARPVSDETSAPEPTPSPYQPWDGSCDMLKHVLLLLFTFGVWYLIWIYRTTGYLNQEEDRPLRTPVNQLLLCLFVPFYLIYWVYQSARRLDLLAHRRGIPSDLSVLCLVLAFFVPILPPALMQDKMNVLAGGRISVSGRPSGSLAQDEDLAARLRAYKALLDEGLITQEDYDAKKMQILDL